MAKEAIVLVEDLSSTCCTCGKGANPRAKRHKKVVSYSSSEKGCGVKFTHIATYRGKETAARWQEERPDLFFAGVGEYIYGKFQQRLTPEEALTKL